VHILIAEDHVDQRYLLELTLQSSGFDVTAVADGAAALAVLQSRPVDLIITDVLMPVMDGYELLHQCKKDPALAGIPVIVYTATYTHRKDREFATGMGASSFLIKPQEPDVILAAIQQVMEQREMGEFPEPSPMLNKEEVYLRRYNERLVEKLEDKVVELEQANALLVQEATVRMQAEERLKLLSASVEQASEAILITDKSGHIQYANPALASLTGFAVEELIGKNPNIFRSGEHNDDYYQQMWSVINRGEAWRGRIVDRKKDASLYPAMLTVSPIRDDDGLVSNYVGIQQDLSDYENLEQQFYQAQKMEAVGTLVGGIAHDFNNMLAGITGNLYMARMAVQDRPEVKRQIDNVEALSFRAAEMIQQLLTFARKGRVSMKQVPLRSFIKETLKFLRASVPEHISLTLDVSDEQLTVNGDATQLHQVIMNLVNNARDALEGCAQPEIQVSLQSFYADEQFVAHHAYFKSGHYARLSVQDNGSGIAAGAIEHIFDPFFTTKEVGKGTGLGLAMVFGAVKTHKGFIEVASDAEQGTRFDVYLPLVAAHEQAAGPRDSLIMNGSGELILCVDDNQGVRTSYRDVLASLGYTVVEAGNGQQAIEAVEQHKAIALVLMDVVMPVMGGVEAARLIRELRPDIRIIFSTGYDKDANLQGEALPDGAVCLSKPQNIDVLSQTIHALLA